MSGFLAICDERLLTVPPVGLDAALAALSHRAPFGIQTAEWAGFVLVGAARRAGSPRELPTSPSGLSVLEDCFLTNAPELRSRLGLTSHADIGEILAAAYDAWGDACVEQLDGDFAFVVLDRRNNRVFAARDHLGVRPFYYQAGKTGWAACSEIRPLIALGLFESHVSERSVAEYLLSLPPPASATFYPSVKRLEPAHIFVSEQNAITMRRYWTLEAQPGVTGEGADQRVRELLIDAVARRGGGEAETGCILSGGLDSTSISCIAARLRIGTDVPAVKTFSVVLDADVAPSERPFIEEAGRTFPMDQTVIPLDQGIHPLRDLPDRFVDQSGLTTAINHQVLSLVHQAAKQSGCTVILDGFGGDETISHGDARFNELADQLKWISLWREVSAAVRVYDRKALPPYIAMLKQSRPLAPLRTAVRALRGKRDDPSQLPPWGFFVRPDVFERFSLSDRVIELDREATQAGRHTRDKHIFTLAQPFLSYTTELIAHASARSGLESRFPFLDRRLVEYCVSLPGDQKLAGSWTRLVLRRAMEGILPPSVQWRRDKTDFTHAVSRGLTVFDKPIVQSILYDRPQLVEPYVDVGKVREAYERLKNPPVRGTDVQAVWRTCALGLWLAERPDRRL
jgi:asparagine synthase (glutamine-hydrolysing)